MRTCPRYALSCGMPQKTSIASQRSSWASCEATLFKEPEQLRSEGEHYVHHETTSFKTNLSSWCGRHIGLAVARRHDSRHDGSRADRCEHCAAHGVRLHSSWRGHGSMVAQGHGQRL